MLYVFRNFFCKICLKNAPFPPSGGCPEFISGGLGGSDLFYINSCIALSPASATNVVAPA